MEVRGLERSLEDIYRQVDARRRIAGELTEGEIDDLVQKCRHGKS